MEWKTIFAEEILARGLDYYERGLVKDLKITGKYLKASVQGNDRYNVVLGYDLSTKQIKHIACDCPYALLGNNCKHLAAFFFYLEHTFNDFNTFKMNQHEIENRKK